MKETEVAKALSDAFAEDRVEVTRHFWDELRADAFVLADVRQAVDALTAVVELGHDRAGNPKFEVTGPAVDGRPLALICSFKDTGAVLLITVYEGSRP
jgi:hypothetical protein